MFFIKSFTEIALLISLKDPPQNFYYYIHFYETWKFLNPIFKIVLIWELPTTILIKNNWLTSVILTWSNSHLRKFPSACDIFDWTFNKKFLSNIYVKFYLIIWKNLLSTRPEITDHILVLLECEEPILLHVAIPTRHFLSRRM